MRKLSEARRLWDTWGSRKSFSKIWSTIAWKADHVHKEFVVLGEDVEKENVSCAGNFCLHILSYYKRDELM